MPPKAKPREDDEAVAAAVNPAEGAVVELAGLMRTLLQTQEARDQRWEKAVESQRFQWETVCHQLQQIQERKGHSEEEESPRKNLTRPEEGRGPKFKEPKLHPLSAEDDVEHFLATFERVAATCGWPRTTWAIRLVPLLTGKARGAFVAMEMEDTENYDLVKEAILRKFDISPETY